MKFLPLLLISVLALSGCASIQPVSKQPDPEAVAQLTRENAEKELHAGMLRLLAPEADLTAKGQSFASFSAAGSDSSRKD